MIITAGGENVSPILIEEDIKNLLPFISNAMVVGDAKYYIYIYIYNNMNIYEYWLKINL